MNNFTRSNTTSFWQSVTNLTCCSIGISKLKSMKVFMVLMLFAFTLGPVLVQGQTRTVDPVDACLPDLSEGQPLPDYLLGMTDEQIENAYGPECDGDKSELSWTRTPVLNSNNTNCEWFIDVELVVICTDTDTGEVTTLADIKFQFNGGDNSPPEISCPADVKVECGDSTDPSETGEATADDCSGVSIGYSDSVEKVCGNSEIITRTWTATDECGNQSSCVQIITVEDSTPPEITCPADAIVECTDPTDPSATGEATATDTCGEVSIEYSDSSAPGCGNTQVITRTWTATDECGNASSCVQTIEVVDTTPPTIDNEPSSPTYECGPGNAKQIEYWLMTNGGATASDTCGEVQWAKARYEFVEDCGEAGTYYATFTAYDECGNMTPIQASLTIKDSTPPTIDTPPSSPTYECGPGNAKQIEYWLMTNGGATASDNCSEVQWAKARYEFDSDCGEAGTYYATFTAYDDCGNMTPIQASLTITDNTPPSITCPADVVVECGDSVDPSATGEATGSDSCGNVSIDFQDSVVEDCGDARVITRTWTATDDCGNSTSCDQIITVEDKTPPSIECPADAIVECGDSTSPDATGMATGSDICGEVSIDYEDSVVENCGNTQVITRTWTATDECGLKTSCDQIIEVVDTTPPSISCPQDAIVECGDSTDPSATGEATGSDRCGDVDITYSDSVVENCGNTQIITRTWEATDECGLKSTCEQIIEVVDRTPPSIECPADAIVECGDSTDPSVTGEATGSDICGDVDITYSDSSDPGCGNTEVITRTWKATDECGLTTTCVQIIEVVDTTPPSITCPADAVVECGDSTDPSATGEATGSDICGDVSIDYSDSVVENCGNTQVITRTWTATDACGLKTTCDQIIEVVDTTPPSIECPQDAIVECGDSTSPDATGMATGSDICGEVSIEYTDSVVENCGNTQVITRTWTATDECGLKTSCDQIIEVVDTTPPSISCPQDAIVECGDPTDPSATGEATGSDICGDVDITYSDSVVENCGLTKTITRTWTATDECGLKTSCDQIIEVIDTTPPTQTGDLPENENELPLCADQMPPAPVAEVLAAFEDTCGEVDYDLETYDAIDECGWSVMYKFYIKDECGNYITDDNQEPIGFKVFYQGSDQTDPELVGVPADLNLDCTDEIPPMAEVTATDNCDDNVEVVPNENIIRGECAGEYTIERTWYAEDACGNSVSATQYIYVTDTTAPVLIDGNPYNEENNLIDACKPETDEDLEALGVPSAEEVEALYMDECGSGETTTREINVNGDDCEWIMWVRYTTVDDCGNDTYFKLWYQGGDDTPPEQVDCFDEEIPLYTSDGADCPADATIGLTVDQEIDINTVWYVAGLQGGPLDSCFVDNCADVEDLTFKVKSVDNGEDQQDPCLKILTVVFDVYDECMNVTKDFVCTFVVIDDEAPVITEAADEVVECDGTDDAFNEWLANNGGHTAVDDCNGVTWTNDYCGDDYVDRLLTSEADFSGDEVLINFDDVTPPEVVFGFTYLSIDQYTSPGVTFNSSDLGDGISDGGTAVQDMNVNYGGSFAGSLPNTVVASQDLIIQFESGVNRVGFMLGSLDGSEIEFKATCLKDGNVVGETTFTMSGTYDPSFYGFESELPFDEFVLEETNSTDLFVFDDLRYEGCDKDDDDQDACSSSTTVTFTATDACGNSSSVTSTFTVQDTKAPVLDCPEDQDLGLNPVMDDNTDLPEGLAVMASYDDECDGEGETGNYSDVISSSTSTEDGPSSVTVDCAGFDFVFYPNGDTYNGKPVYQSNSFGANLIMYYSEFFQSWDTFDLIFLYYPWWANGDTEYPPCSTDAYYNNTICSIDVSCQYPEEYTLTRTFTAADECGNEGECDVVYTWVEDGYHNYGANGSGRTEDLGTIPCDILEDVQRDAPWDTQAAADEGDLRGVEIDFTAYPVPFDREVNIKYNFEFNTDVQIDVFDTKGLLVMSEKHNNYSRGVDAITKLDLSRAGEQVFYVTVTTNRGSVTKKIVSNTLKRR